MLYSELTLIEQFDQKDNLSSKTKNLKIEIFQRYALLKGIC